MFPSSGVVIVSVLIGFLIPLDFLRMMAKIFFMFLATDPTMSARAMIKFIRSSPRAISVYSITGSGSVVSSSSMTSVLFFSAFLALRFWMRSEQMSIKRARSTKTTSGP